MTLAEMLSMLFAICLRRSTCCGSHPVPGVHPLSDAASAHDSRRFWRSANGRFIGKTPMNWHFSTMSWLSWVSRCPPTIMSRVRKPLVARQIDSAYRKGRPYVGLLSRFARHQTDVSVSLCHSPTSFLPPQHSAITHANCRTLTPLGGISRSLTAAFRDLQYVAPERFLIPECRQG